MKNKKRDMIQFLVWMRNGTAFCTTWFLILLLIQSYAYNRQTIATNSLTKRLLLIVGGVFLFSIFFTKLFIKQWSFTKRLNGFMISFILYECAGFYWMGIFRGTGTWTEWLIFIGIVCGLYGLCMMIYERYRAKQGEIYTQALQRYQEQRSKEDGK